MSNFSLSARIQSLGEYRVNEFTRKEEEAAIRVFLDVCGEVQCYAKPEDQEAAKVALLLCVYDMIKGKK